MARKNKTEGTQMPEQLETKPTTKRARKKQEVLPEVQAALDAVVAAKAKAKQVAKDSKLTASIVHAITKSDATPHEALSRAAAAFGLWVGAPIKVEPTEAQLTKAIEHDEALARMAIASNEAHSVLG